MDSTVFFLDFAVKQQCSAWEWSGEQGEEDPLELFKSSQIYGVPRFGQSASTTLWLCLEKSFTVF